MLSELSMSAMVLDTFNRFAFAFGTHIFKTDRLNFAMQIESVHKRTAYFVQISFYACRAALACLCGVVVISASVIQSIVPLNPSHVKHRLEHTLTCQPTKILNFMALALSVVRLAGMVARRMRRTRTSDSAAGYKQPRL